MRWEGGSFIDQRLPRRDEQKKKSVTLPACRQPTLQAGRVPLFMTFALHTQEAGWR